MDRKLQFTFPQASIKDAQATVKPSAPKEKNSTLQNMTILYFFLYLWAIFALSDPDPDPVSIFVTKSPEKYGEKLNPA